VEPVEYRAENWTPGRAPEDLAPGAGPVFYPGHAITSSRGAASSATPASKCGHTEHSPWPPRPRRIC
jgi:hypothetical protein